MIKIKRFSCVAPPTEESKALFEAIMALKGKDLLELGTGTGYVAIAASKEGKKVIATDINPKAVEACKINAKLNNINLEVIQSDLFTNVGGKFYIISFNPPIRRNKLVRSFLRYTYSKLSKAVLGLIDRLFIEGKDYLKKDGSILICIINNFEEHTKKISEKRGYNSEVMKNFGYGKVYRFYLK